MSTVAALAPGSPAPAGLFSGKAPIGGSGFMAVMAAMDATAEEATAVEEKQVPAAEQESVAETPAAPYLNTVSPFRNHLSEVQISPPGEVKDETGESVPNGSAGAAAADQVTAVRDSPVDEAQAADDVFPAAVALPVPAPVSTSLPTVSARGGEAPVGSDPTVPARGGEASGPQANAVPDPYGEAPATSAPGAQGPASATPPSAGPPAAPLQVLAALAGRPAKAALVVDPAHLQAVQPVDTGRLPAPTMPENVVPTQAEAPAAPATVAAPVQIQTQSVQSAPTAQSVHLPAHVQQPLHTQLAKPLFTLAAAGNGEHVMTMKVTPEDLGTVTVRAVIGPDGVRMELFAADAGRDAVKAIMPELRRELAGAGLNASLDLGNGARPETSGGEGRHQRETRSADTYPRQGSREQTPTRSQRMFTDRAASLDVLA